MKVEDISPNHLLDQHNIALLKDVGLLLSRADEFVDISCPACGKKERKFKFKKYEFNYWDCSNCNTFYISPRPSVPVLKWFYEQSYTYEYFEEHIFSETENNRREKIVVPRVDQVIDICKSNGINNGSILEIGSAYGTFIKEVESRNYFDKVVGIEANAKLADKTKNEGLDVISGVIEEYHPEGEARFDVVVCFEVLEHLFSPSDFVQKCKSLLQPNGLLILTCPNGLGFEVLCAGVHSDTVDHEHLNYLNPESMKILFERNALEFVSVSTPGKLDLDYLRLKYEEGHKELQNDLLRYIFEVKWDSLGDKLQEMLTQLNMSAHMMTVGRNIE